MNFKERWYFYRDNENAPRITVYLIKDLESGNVARGVSICSSRDIINKKEGRRIAKNRALKALYTKSDSMPIYTHLLYTVDTEAIDFLFNKSTYNPTLTEFENKLLNFEKTLQFQAA